MNWSAAFQSGANLAMPCASALWRACWQGSFAIGFVFLVCRSLRSMRCDARAWLWRGAYLRLLLALIGCLTVPAPAHLVGGGRAAVQPPVVAHADTASAASALGQGSPDPHRAGVEPRAARAEPSGAGRLSLLISGLVLLWGVGVLVCLFRVAGEWVAAGWLRRLAEPIHRGEALFDRDLLAAEMGMEKLPELLMAESVGSPVLLGGARPAIVLPTRLAGECSDTELRMVIAHEMAHYRRRDLLWGWLPALGHALFYFLPTEWLAAREYDCAQEMACDEVALRYGDASAGEYGEMLVKVAALHKPNLQSRLVTVGVAETPETIKRRLLAMKLPRTSRAGAPAAAGLAIATLCIALPLQFGQAPAAAASHRAGRADLSYHPKAGQSYLYAVRIQSETPHYDEVSSGNVTYTVGTGAEDGVTITCSGNLIPQRKSRDGSFDPGGPFYLHQFGFDFLRHGPFAAPNKVRIDPGGHLLQIEGDSQLPRALGDLSQLVIETLASEGKSWETDNHCAIVVTEFHPVAPLSHFGREEQRNLPATEHTVYSIGSESGALTTVHKHYELKTRDTVGGQPRFMLSGDGDVVFDKILGMPRSLEFKAKLVDRNTANTVVETPITLTYKLLEGASREQALNPPAPVKPEAKPLSAGDIDQAIVDLRTQDSFKVMGAASKLAGAAPTDADRDRVTRALASALTHKDGFARQWATKALGVWGTPDAVPSVIKRLEDESFAVRWAALEALGELHDVRAAAPVAALLQKDHDFAARSLIAMGPRAASAVVKYLKDPDWSVRMQACIVLKEIGGTAQANALREATADENGLVKMKAAEALKAIEGRGRTPHSEAI